MYRTSTKSTKALRLKKRIVERVCLDLIRRDLRRLKLTRLPHTAMNFCSVFFEMIGLDETNLWGERP